MRPTDSLRSTNMQMMIAKKAWNMLSIKERVVDLENILTVSLKSLLLRQPALLVLSMTCGQVAYGPTRWDIVELQRCSPRELLVARLLRAARSRQPAVHARAVTTRTINDLSTSPVLSLFVNYSCQPDKYIRTQYPAVDPTHKSCEHY